MLENKLKKINSSQLFNFRNFLMHNQKFDFEKHSKSLFEIEKNSTKIFIKSKNSKVCWRSWGKVGQ